MYRSLFTLILTGGIAYTMNIAPAFAADVKKDAKKVGRKGIYGTNTLEALDEDGLEEKEAPVETEQERKLKAKYPSSKTSRSKVNQSSHQHTLSGMKNYFMTRKLFKAASNIKSSLDDSALLKVKQSMILQSRLEPKDLLLYGADNAYIGLRIRVLETEVLPEIKKAVSSFSQAKALSPSNAAIQKWHRIAVDTQKVVLYHLKFYKLSAKAARLGMTQEQLDQLARLWAFNVNPKNAKTLTTMVKVGFLKELDESAEAVSFEAVKSKLPNLDFKVKY